MSKRKAMKKARRREARANRLAEKVKKDKEKDALQAHQKHIE